MPEGSIMDLESRVSIKAVTIAGITITAAFVCSAIVFANSHYDTSQREGAWSVMAASSWLEIVWLIPGIVLATMRWKATTLAFRLVFALNAAIAILLLADFLLHR
jgi:hypothetical protein